MTQLTDEKPLSRCDDRAVRIGFKRNRVEDPIDFMVGILLEKKIADRVNAEIYHAARIGFSEERLQHALEIMKNGYEIHSRQEETVDTYRA